MAPVGEFGVGFARFFLTQGVRNLRFADPSSLEGAKDIPDLADLPARQRVQI
jgi:hypothetical protein